MHTNVISPSENEADQGTDGFVRLPEMERLTGVSAMTLWRWERAGIFPKRVNIGPNTIGWSRREYLNWEAARIAERDHQQAA